MKIKTMMEAIQRHNKMLEYLRKNHPANLAKDKEDGFEAVWNLSKSKDPFHSEGISKTRHNEDQDE